MIGDGGNLVVTFNGEIYNYPALRKRLEADGVRFATTSDTEALLHLYARHGAGMVHELRGMFAFAIWDERKRGLFLARDPYGIKPLYTANDGRTFRFASQVKAVLTGEQVSRDLDPAGVVGFFVFGSVPEPFSLYREISTLPAGHTQWIDEAGAHAPKPYAGIAEILAAGSSDPIPSAELPQRLRTCARDSVQAHLLADVEVGLFLSAGVDSGSLLGLMRDAGQRDIRALESAHYLRNQLLRDADWAGMAHSIEIRVPLVDAEVLKGFAPALPALKPGQGKAAPARSPSLPLPEEIVARAKTGFGVPTGAWLAKALAGEPKLAAEPKGLISRNWSRVVLPNVIAASENAKLGALAS